MNRRRGPAPPGRHASASGSQARGPSVPARHAPARSASALALPPLPLHHPALLLVALVCAALVALSVTMEVSDPDLWQHLTVGRFMWEQHRFPTVQLWTWPTYGTPDVDYAWGFEALLWPFWKLGGLTGLYLWRWLTTLAVFGFVWAAARRMGARGLVPLLVIALCSMVYRWRSSPRPETVAAVLLAAEIWLLESRRHGSRVHAAWLVLMAWIWANTHLTYYLLFAVLGIHALVASLPGRREGAPPARTLWLAALASLGVMLVNPFGWQVLWQPFYHFLFLRHELLFKSIGELLPVDWKANVRDGLPVLFALWPLLALVRARRGRLERVEIATCLFFSVNLLVGQRFMGTYALAAAVYVGRDLDEWAQAWTRPVWAARPWPRAALAAAACVLVTLPELTRPSYGIDYRLNQSSFPVAACDFVQRHDLHGRLFNQFDYGGYICFRFWPRRDQLPFMAIHLEGTKELRALYSSALLRRSSWQQLERTYRFDYLVLTRPKIATDYVRTFLDRDTSWVRVFLDDAAYVYVRDRGPFARLAADSGYRVIPADPDSLTAFGRRTTVDPTLRRRAEAELWREVRGSRFHAKALNLLANIALFESRWDDARRELEEAIAIDPLTVDAREKLGIIALQQGRPREALRWFEADRRVLGYRGGMEFRRGQVAEAEGDLTRALEHYREELRHGEANPEVRDSVESLSRRLGR